MHQFAIYEMLYCREYAIPTVSVLYCYSLFLLGMYFSFNLSFSSLTGIFSPSWILRGMLCHFSFCSSLALSLSSYHNIWFHQLSLLVVVVVVEISKRRAKDGWIAEEKEWEEKQSLAPPFPRRIQLLWWCWRRDGGSVT